jgi:hypothetical protein
MNSPRVIIVSSVERTYKLIGTQTAARSLKTRDALKVLILSEVKEKKDAQKNLY